MARAVVTVPPDVWRQASVPWDIDWRGQSADRTSGIQQSVYNRFPRWQGRVQLNLTRSALLGWRAVRAALQGRTKVLRVPMGDWAVSFGIEDECGVLWSEGQTWGTGQPWALVPVVTLTAAASAGAESITVDEHGLAVTVGQFLSIYDWPMVVTSRTVSGGTATLTVSPPMRVAAAVGAGLRRKAFGRFELVSDTDGNPEFSLVPYAQPVIGLVEDLAR